MKDIVRFYDPRTKLSGLKSDGIVILRPKYQYIHPFKENIARVINNGFYSYIRDNGELITHTHYDYALDFNNKIANISKNGKYGILDSNGNRLTGIIYNYKIEFKEGMARVCVNNKWGYINRRGEEIIPCKFDYAHDFSEGLACVNIKGNLGIINKHGTLSTTDYDFDWGVEGFKNNLLKVKYGSNYGFIDLNGDIIVPVCYKIASDFSEGKTCVYKNGDWFVLDTNGEILLGPLQYTYIRQFSGGIAGVHVAVGSEDKYGYIDLNGKEVVPPEYDGFDPQQVKKGFIPVRLKKYLRNPWYLNKNDYIDYWGLINRNNELLAPIKYHSSEILRVTNFIEKVEINDFPALCAIVRKFLNYYDYFYEFSDGLYRVIKNNQYGFVDRNGEEVIPIKFDKASDFKEGKASVMIKSSIFHKYYVINQKGEILFRFNNKNNTTLPQFSEGLMLVENTTFLRDFNYYFIDRAGQIVMKLKYDYVESFSCGLALVKSQSKCGYINHSGEIIIPLIYNIAESFKKGVAAVGINHDNMFDINKDGRIID